MVTVNEVVRALAVDPSALSEDESAMIRRLMAGSSPNVDLVLQVADANVDKGYVDTSRSSLEALGKAMAVEAGVQTVGQLSKSMSLSDLKDVSSVKSAVNTAVETFNDKVGAIGKATQDQARSEMLGRDKPSIQDTQQVDKSIQAVTEAVQDKAKEMGQLADKALSDVESNTGQSTAGQSTAGTCTGSCTSSDTGTASGSTGATGSEGGTTGGNEGGNAGGNGTGSGDTR